MYTNLVTAEKELSPLFSALIKAKNSTEEQFNAMPVEFNVIARRRTQSSYINDLMVINLKNYLSNIEGVNFVDSNGQTKFIYNDKYIIKVKQINKNKKISFIATQAAMDFLYGLEYQLSLPGIDVPNTNLILGYKMNSLHTEIENLIILHPDGLNHFSWEYEVAEVQPINMENKLETNETNTIKTKRVTPKNKFVNEI
jgi:hypothetical protein